MKRYRLSNKQLRELETRFPFLSSSDVVKDGVEVVELDSSSRIYLSISRKIPIIYETVGVGGEIVAVPTLHAVHRLNLVKPEPYVVVDQGAVKHILNGADVMRPGITQYAEFNYKDTVFVLDPRHRAIAVGQALVASSELSSMQRGKVVKNLHYLGDDIWNFRP